jgi:hypothetical protein
MLWNEEIASMISNKYRIATKNSIIAITNAAIILPLAVAFFTPTIANTIADKDKNIDM